MSAQDVKIAIVAYQYSVVVKGIERKLRDLGYDTRGVDTNLLAIKDLTSATDLFMIYLPSDIMDVSAKQSVLHEICRIILGSGRKIAFIGENVFHGDLIKTIPMLDDLEWIERPIDMETLPEKIEHALKTEVSKGNRRRILIVDDDPAYARMVREWLKDIYKVDIVTNGMQAITFLLKTEEDEKVDLILLDYEMPVADGPQVLQMLKQEEETKKIPVVFLTGNGTKEAVERVMALKPEGYVLKSAARGELRQYLKQKLG